MGTPDHGVDHGGSDYTPCSEEDMMIPRGGSTTQASPTPLNKCIEGDGRFAHMRAPGNKDDIVEYDQPPVEMDDSNMDGGQTRGFPEIQGDDKKTEITTPIGCSTPVPSIGHPSATNTDGVNTSPVVGGTDRNEEGGQVGGSLCVHDENGKCSIHGEGAKEKRKPDGKIKYKGRDGKTRYKVKKLFYFECDIAPGGGGRLRQTKLSFMPLLKTTCPGTSANIDVHTSKVGQDTVDSIQTDERFSEYGEELESCTDSGMALPVNERP